MAQVILENVDKIYPGGVKAVDDFNLHIKDTEFIVLVGPSGCGKSTTLRMVAGLEEITDGTVKIGQRIVNDVAPKDRDIAMVFQNYALYPHMTVYKNMAFGLKLRRMPKLEIDKKVREAAKILGIGDLLDRKPKALSGGQRQRVAVGRAIVRDPACFLFDEPLSNLDAKLRVEMRAEIKRLHLTLSTTTIYVTHDQEEAMTLGDRVVVMKDGVIQQCEPPLQVYRHPENLFVAGFVGTPPMNMLIGQIDQADGALWFTESKPTDEEHKLIEGRKEGAEKESAFQGATTEQPPQRIRVPDWAASSLEPKIGQHVILGIRPEGFHYEPAGSQTADDGYSLEAMINVTEPLGDKMDLYLSTGVFPHVIGRVEAHMELEPQKLVKFRMNPVRLHYFDPQDNGRNLALEAERKVRSTPMATA